MKEDTYKQTLRSIELLIDGETDLISILSTVSCELFHIYEHWNWVGFYRMVDEKTLKVGPYQGSHGCLTIDIKRGVCGKCVREAAIQVENNVTELVEHIACSSDTLAEIVLPIFGKDNQVVAVLDIDSVKADVFDDVDIEYLTKISQLVSDRYSSL